MYKIYTFGYIWLLKIIKTCFYNLKNLRGGIIMYYSNGNYEAFAHPRKPEGVDEKSAYLVGAGLARSEEHTSELQSR